MHDGCRQGKWVFSVPFGMENSVLCLEEIGVLLPEMAPFGLILCHSHPVAPA